MQVMCTHGGNQMCLNLGIRAEGGARRDGDVCELLGVNSEYPQVRRQFYVLLSPGWKIPPLSPSLGGKSNCALLIVYVRSTFKSRSS